MEQRNDGIPPLTREKYRDIFENAPVGIFQSTFSGRFISVNRTLAVMFGYPGPERMIHDVSDIAVELFVHPEQRPDIIRRVRDSEKYIRDEVDYRRRDGSTFRANLYMRKVGNEQDGVHYLEGYVEDITERKIAEERLRQYQDNLERLVGERTAELERTNRKLQDEIDVRIAAEKLLVDREARYRDLVESANSVILRWLPDGRVTFFNKFARDFFGYTEEEILGQNIVGTIVPETDSTGRDLAALVDDIVARPDAYVRNENENMRKNGERVWIAWTNKTIFDGEGGIAEILSIGVDITQLVLTERELRRTMEDLAVAKERAEAADRLKSAFLATMSHELRTPLNSIIGFTGIILQGLVGPLNNEQKKQLGMVQASANHLLSLINDVLDISKIEAGQLQVACEPFDLRQMVVRTVQAVRPLAEVKGLELTADIGPGDYTVNSDQRRVEQVLLNLLGNAVKFTGHGQVSLTCSLEPEKIIFNIKDSGIGIKGEDIDTIFKPFQQIDTGLTRKYEGTGLGLSICKRLVELLGGEIWVESVWGAGSRFGFSLPTERKAR
ncbi:MAG TPA: PAS domain S-box protein [Geobacteraceae bacterium]|nr:PAS domain S-box protein [Geobacteraceae bacterium]